MSGAIVSEWLSGTVCMFFFFYIQLCLFWNLNSKGADGGSGER